MSLQVWLPLNGDLHNQGASNPTISLASGNTWASSGKIGNGSLTLTKLQTILPTSSCMTGAKEISYCYWVKVNTAWSTQWLDGIRWIETNGSTTSTARQEFYTNCTLVGTWYKGGSISGKAFTPGVWTHLAATFNYNTGEANFYIDGILKGTTTNIDKTYYCRGDFYIGDNGVDICQNDVRIYDHALSAAEVKEISQGLVLHYKLNQPIGLIDAILNQDTYTVYNNYAGSGTTGTLTNLSETFNGHVVRREVMTPNDTSVNNFKSSLGSHGVYGHRQTFLANTKYVFWIYYRPISHTDVRAGGTASNIGGWTEIPPVAVGGGWYRVGQYRNGTVTTDKTDNIFTSFYTPTAASGVPITIDWAAPHLLVGTTEIPDDDSFMGNDYVEDSSGYGHHGSILNTVSPSSDTPRYSASTNLSATNSMINCGRGGMVTDSITVNFWLKSSSWGNPVSCTEGGGWNFEGDGDYFRFPIYISGVGYKYGKSVHTRAQICNNQWHMLTGIYDRINQKVQIYVDGQLDNDYTAGTSNNIGYNGSNVIWIGAEATGSNTTASNGMAGLFSDFRIYSTPLSAADILELYHTGAKIDNLGNTHTYEFIEYSDNILFDVEKARTDLQFKDGLSLYTQSKCQVTLTEDGYHIYRPPNLTVSSDGYVMWGGLKLVNQTSDGIHAYISGDNRWGLQKSHTYIFAFHAKGQSTNSPALKVESNMGWDRIAGVGPNPTYLATSTIPANFNGEKDCFIIFTINDDVVKTATEAKSSYAAGTQYLSYRHLCLNYEYTDTGALGTDLYLTNFRLYDITSHMAQFTKQGQANFYDIVEQMDKCQIRKNSELLSSEFIEL